MYMKKVITFLLAISAILFFTNDSYAQKSAKKVESPAANKYVLSSSNSSVKIHQPVKNDVRNALLERLDAVNASTTLTAAEKQAIIDQINAKLADLG